MDSTNPPTKPCHNCRRQRLRCDQSYPHCNKCTAAGKECLGYGKLFRWTGAVASRGKLAGRTSSAPVDAAARTAARATRVAGRKADLDFLTPSSSPPALCSDAGTPVDMSMSEYQGDVKLVLRSPSPESAVTSPWALADPLYQDMQYDHRYYLSYFTNRVCKDLVSQDVPERNPFRGLLPLTRAHPLLQHIIVAASAAHMSNLVRAPLANHPKGVDDGVTAGIEQASRRALQDALVAKSKALTLMRGAVENIKTTGGDVVLAAALFFINVELIESGKHGWKAHLEGAGRIMSLLQPDSVADTALRDYMLSDCFIYFILASAFMPAASFDTQSYFQPSQIPFILQRAAANSYLCCPPEILTILHSASQLSNVSPDVAPEEDVRAAGLVLIQEAQAFDINGWANDVRNMSYLQDAPIQSRIHAGSAHRLAACLYILQAIPSMSQMNDHGQVAEALSRDIFKHLSSIPDNDPNFKATTWPTFIAGAEAGGRARREWVMDRLQRLVRSCPWGFIYTAMETLQVIWDLDNKGQGTKSWVQTLKDPQMNFLMV
ncbi:Zn(2)-Cys(6) zinc finger domain protein [Metarhizium robertsii]|uniref:Acriflavine sensitivity control protein acr-2 n=2 Tax=Metarhizium robertsii TaxID=568076 RepID=E9F845_METRA|nr:acriflavine sensitivity control protein acr-2 [Metarhizium robertsii ARSEF 23]EFY96137.2 acriflavine sensitivity control protein acr-2 [Metarhizium robertsii ARSEF 23]EXU98337.1 Zn(2)-Cys(6) zinc finger domain protein [Metarhizium robertsii]